SFDQRGADLRHTAHHVNFLTVSQRGLPDILALGRTFTPSETHVVRPRCYCHTASHPGVDQRLRLGERLPLLLMILWTADRGRERLLTVDRDDERVRRVVTFNADVPFFHAAEEAGRQLVFAVGGEDVTDNGTAARAERQTLDIAVLAELAGDRVF